MYRGNNFFKDHFFYLLLILIIYNVLKQGEKLTLLRRVDNNWYEGINEKQDVGIFPVTYVEAIKQPIGKRLIDYLNKLIISLTKNTWYSNFIKKKVSEKTIFLKFIFNYYIIIFFFFFLFLSLEFSR